MSFILIQRANNSCNVIITNFKRWNSWCSFQIYFVMEITVTIDVIINFWLRKPLNRSAFIKKFVTSWLFVDYSCYPLVLVGSFLLTDDFEIDKQVLGADLESLRLVAISLYYANFKLVIIFVKSSNILLKILRSSLLFLLWVWGIELICSINNLISSFSEVGSSSLHK